MADETLEQVATREGISMKMLVDDGLRYSYCDAHMADLVSIEGTQAVYRGECSNRHQYEMRREIDEIRQNAHIQGGQMVYGDDKGFVAPGAESEPTVNF